MVPFLTVSSAMGLDTLPPFPTSNVFDVMSNTLPTSANLPPNVTNPTATSAPSIQNISVEGITNFRVLLKMEKLFERSNTIEEYVPTTCISTLSSATVVLGTSVRRMVLFETNTLLLTWRDIGGYVLSSVETLNTFILIEFALKLKKLMLLLVRTRLPTSTAYNISCSVDHVNADATLTFDDTMLLLEMVRVLSGLRVFTCKMT